MSEAENRVIYLGMAIEKRRIICSGCLSHVVRVPPHVYEAFLEVCCLVLILCDADGYVALGDDGVVDQSVSYGPFMEQFVAYVEATHVRSITHCLLGHVVQARSRRRDKHVLIGFEPYF